MHKLLYVHQVSAVGGGSYCLLNIIKELDRTLYEPAVLLRSHGPLSDELNKLDVAVFYLSELREIPYNKSLLSKGVIRAYYKIIRNGIDAFKSFISTHRFDIVYLNNMMLYPYLIPAKDLGCKTIIHVREHWPLEEHKFQLKIARKIVSSYADKVVAINKYSANIFPNSFPIVIYDWIDMDSRYKKMDLSVIFDEDVSEKKILLFTGGPLMIKGALEVVRAFSSIHNSQWRLLMLGDYTYCEKEKGLKSKVKRFLELFGRKNYLKELAFAISSDYRIKCMPSLYEVTDIFKKSYCMLSFFTIPHANLALAEAIICGLPCIAANTPESVEYSNNGKSVMLYPINDFDAFKQRLSELDDSLAFLKKESSEISPKIQLMFDRKENSHRLAGVYNSLI